MASIDNAMRPAMTRAAEAPAYYVVGDVYRFLLTGEQTGGAYALFDAEVSPGGGPPPHIHASEEEIFHIVEGEVTFYSEAGERVARVGDTVFMPRGTRHNFRNNTDRPARMMISVVPAGLDAYFREVGIPVTDPSGPRPAVDAEYIANLLAQGPKYGLTFPQL